uniref:Uncharacterized protein n=1 Tax=Dictyoglomus turgidum TaxID=513050 RepID=A0A7C3WW64_9BACT
MKISEFFKNLGYPDGIVEKFEFIGKAASLGLIGGNGIFMLRSVIEHEGNPIRISYEDKYWSTDFTIRHGDDEVHVSLIAKGEDIQDCIITKVYRVLPEEGIKIVMEQ